MPDSIQNIFFTVTSQDHGKRLDAFLAQNLAELGISREKVKSFIKNGVVCIDKKTATSPKDLVLTGCIVNVAIPVGSSSVLAEEGEVCTLYKDAELAIIDKPADLTVHPCPSCPEGTLANRLLSHFPELSSQDGSRPGIVHRLDKDTSGILLVALTERCRLALAEMFAERDINKQYLAIVHGVPKTTTGIIDEPIGRHPLKKILMAISKTGRPAHTSWQTLYADPAGLFSILAVRILTGRTHQIRVHLTHIGHPIIGDPLYTGTPAQQKALAGLSHCPKPPKRQMLHACQISFAHPFPELIPEKLPPHITRDGEMLQCTLPPPEDFMETLVQLTSPCLRVVITGSPGCGKSTLLHALEQQGLPVSSADAVVQKLYEPDGDGWRLLQARFGDRFFTDPIQAQASGHIKKIAPIVDKSKLGKSMAEDPALRREIEALIHPLVAHAHKEFFQVQESKGSAINVVEIPLYIESGYQQNKALHSKNGLAPVLVGITCPQNLRHKRLAENRAWTQEKITFIESWQLSQEEKMQQCDIVIANDKLEEDLRSEAKKLIEQLETIQSLRAKDILQGLQSILIGQL